MADEERTDRMLDALVANTEAMTHLNASVSSLRDDYADGRKAAREFSNGLAAKVDNMDRSVSEMKLGSESAEVTRQAELKRIYDHLGEERKDRRAGAKGERNALTNERDHVRDMVREELGDHRGQRDKQQGLMVAAGKEIWKVGGKYVVASLCIIIIAAVMKMTGTSLADIIGLTAGK